MYGDVMAFDVLKNALIGCGLAPKIVLGLQPINGYNQLQVWQFSP